MLAGRGDGLIDAIDANVEMQWADGNAFDLLLAGLHDKGRARVGFEVEPGAEEAKQPLALSVDVCGGPAGGGAGVVAGDGRVDALREEGIAVGDGHGAQSGLRAHLKPEIVQHAVDDAAAVAGAETERDILG